MRIRIRLVTSLRSLDPAALRLLEDPDYPFTDQEFLLALEESGSVDGKSGWQSAHVIAVDEQDRVLGLLLCYAKTHSYGEYVFDWEWARFFQAHGVAYYPKLTSALPFTPAAGPRILLMPGADHAVIRKELTAAAVDIANNSDMSSCHALFLNADDLNAFKDAGFTERHSCQYQWTNRGYRSFQDFVETFISKRRRDVLRERRRAQEHGLTFSRLTGSDLTPAHAEAMERLYLNTTAKKNAIPYLQTGFFARLFGTMADRILLVAAHQADGEMVAGALNFFKGSHLYGRYWGSIDLFQDLHFELCYYQTIDFAIAYGIQRFEAGAQGEHKIQRGFLPSLIYSAHLILDDRLRQPIDRYIGEEREAIAQQMVELMTHSPFRPETVDQNGNSSRTP